MAILNQTNDEKLFKGILRLNAKILGLILGIVFGLIVFIATLLPVNNETSIFQGVSHFLVQ